MPKPPQYPVRSIVPFLSISPPDGLQTSVKLAHLSACPCIPTSLSAPPTVLPLSSSCSRSAARACSQAEPLPQRSLKRCCASSVRRPNVSGAASSGPPISSWSRTAPYLLAPHGRAIHRRRLCNGARASDARMSTATLKRELALLRSSLAALTPAQSATLDDPVAWAERIAGLTLDPWQRDVLLSVSPRLLLNATRQSGKSTVAALKAAWTVLQGGLAVVVSPSLRQSGFLFRKLTRHLVASDAGFRRETHDRGRAGLGRVGGQPARRSSRHAARPVAAPRRPGGADRRRGSRVRDELWATISPMLAAAPAAQQILLSTPAGASGEFHRAWSSDEDWERVQITADQCPRISAEHLAAERIRLGDALYRQEYFGAFVSAPGSVFDAEVLAHMFGDDAEDEPDRSAPIVHGRMVDRFLQ